MECGSHLKIQEFQEIEMAVSTNAEISRRDNSGHFEYLKIKWSAENRTNRKRNRHQR